MQKQTLALVVGAFLLVSAGALTVPRLLTEDAVPLMEWSQEDEVDTAQHNAEVAGIDVDEASSERTAVEFAEGTPTVGEGRVAVVIRGRVIDKYNAPVNDAMVWLEHSRAGRRSAPDNRRRVPDPIHTDSDGRFAFQGQAFRNLRVSLQVKHGKHAPGMFDRDIGDVAEAAVHGKAGSVIDLGDLVLMNGGQILGRVTDLEGNGIAAASIELGPENRNGWRFMRNRDEFLTKLTTDTNGYYRMQNVPVGDWSASATATRHTEGRSATFAVEEDKPTEVEDIRLGPGFEVTGVVLDQRSQPIAKARVSMRSVGGNRGGPGGRADSGGPAADQGGRGGRGGRGGFGGNTHSTLTDDKGRFFLEHLPAVTMRLDVSANGYLQYQLEEIDPKLGQPIHITMQDGMRIAGTVLDGVDGQPVTLFAVNAVRVRGLPVPGLENVDIGELMQRMRDGNLDEATRQQLRTQMEAVRSSIGNRGGPGGPGGRGGRGGEDGRGGPDGRGGSRDDDKPERHPGGTFVLTGLQEGVYEVTVKSPDHAFLRTDEIEVRVGVAANSLTLRLDRGFYCAGIVVDDNDRPVVGANVSLRAVTELDGAAAGNRDQRNGQVDFGAMARQFARRANGADLRIEAKTNEEGEFVLTHVPKGTYRLSAEADGFSAPEEATIELLNDRSDGRIVLGTLGTLTGKVIGLREGEAAEANVAAVRIAANDGGGNPWGQMFGRGGRGGFGRASVRADGTYRIDELEPGNYLVRAYVGSQQDIMRQLMPQFMSGQLQADIGVKAGETSRLDVQLIVPQQGAVQGSVMHNGAAAVGFRVELTAVDTGTAEPNFGDRGGRGGRGGWGRNQATVASSGNFKIEDVTAGQYTLRVVTDARATLHEETIFVSADSTSEHHISLSTSSLKGTVSTTDDTTPSELDGNVLLLAGLTELPPDFQQGRRGGGGNGAMNARVRDGSFEFEAVPPGNYLMVLNVRGRERTTAPIVIGASGPQQTTIPVGAVAPVDANAPRANPPAGTNPGNNGFGGRRGGARNGGQGGGRNGGGDGGGNNGGGGRGGR